MQEGKPARSHLQQMLYRLQGACHSTEIMATRKQLQMPCNLCMAKCKKTSCARAGAMTFMQSDDYPGSAKRKRQTTYEHS